MLFEKHGHMYEAPNHSLFKKHTVHYFHFALLESFAIYHDWDLERHIYYESSFSIYSFSVNGLLVLANICTIHASSLFWITTKAVLLHDNTSWWFSLLKPSISCLHGHISLCSGELHNMHTSYNHKLIMHGNQSQAYWIPSHLWN